MLLPPGAEVTRRSPAESKMVDFAEDLGRLLGTAQAKAEGWLGQRQAIATQLAQIRDTATKYLQELSGSAASLAGAIQRGRRGRPAGSKNKRGPGRPKGSGKKKRTMSAAARKAISDAQKKRWAAQKAK